MKIGPDISISPITEVQRQKQAKLVDSAQQFEATMLQELLKPMQHAKGDWGDEERDEDSASDTLSSFGTEAVAKAISKGGGFGIAQRVVEQITQEHQRR
jgi:peptidoglycan hydrolase FlgJ